MKQYVCACPHMLPNVEGALQDAQVVLLCKRGAEEVQAPRLSDSCVAPASQHTPQAAGSQRLQHAAGRSGATLDRARLP